MHEKDGCGGRRLKMTKKIDPMYIDIPNICFSLSSKTDPREKRFKEQRLKVGFDDSETWCLSATIAAFAIPRLKRLKEVQSGYPMGETELSWDKKLDKIILAFELITRNNAIWIFSKKEQKAVSDGMDLFREHFFDLGW